ncbi:transcriptional regulator [Beggiatoa alba B18LD]|uniref:Transcriptional regulator n=1 Tax=Beggiatoa alba B18LD TaxID=395493 RepID=I3CKU4_9GAMM|nr:helix-turn-helix domain-containing protein [Beggiatoa alba]EIJ44237.1 transcriptional regulator [Beggiatoa alba B18LD]
MVHSPEGKVLTDTILEIFRVNGELLTTGDALVAELGINSARWQVLGAMAYALPHAVTVPQIASVMGVTRQGVQKNINLLLQQSLVVKQSNPADSRSYLYQLSPTGLDVYHKVERLQMIWVNRLAQGITRENLQTTLHTLQQLREHLVND